MLTDVIGDALEVGVIDFAGTIERMKGGKLRMLAITAAQRDPGFPAIPTRKESGFPDFETSVWSAFFMRAETPDDVVDKFAAAIQKVMTCEPGKAHHASRPSQPMLIGPKAPGEFQRFKCVADAAGIHPEWVPGPPPRLRAAATPSGVRRPNAGCWTPRWPSWPSAGRCA